MAQQRPVTDMVFPAFRNALRLAAFAAVFSMLVGSILAAWMTFSRGRIARSVASLFALFAASTPQYSLGILLIIVFAVT